MESKWKINLVVCVCVCACVCVCVSVCVCEYVCVCGSVWWCVWSLWWIRVVLFHLLLAVKSALTTLLSVAGLIQANPESFVQLANNYNQCRKYLKLPCSSNVRCNHFRWNNFVNTSSYLNDWIGQLTVTPRTTWQLYATSDRHTGPLW